MPQFVKSTRLSLGAAGGAAAASLGFTIQAQSQTNWCWAAVSTSTSLFYNAASGWTQCKVANAELGQTTCCTNGTSTACNKLWYLDRALTRTGNLRSVVSGTITFALIQAEINGNSPIGARIGWTGGGGHFVVIDGFDSTTQSITIRDPLFGTSTYVLAAFSTKYRQSGAWTHTYKTKP
jgi:hypothetical protein